MILRASVRHPTGDVTDARRIGMAGLWGWRSGSAAGASGVLLSSARGKVRVPFTILARAIESDRVVPARMSPFPSPVESRARHPWIKPEW